MNNNIQKLTNICISFHYFLVWVEQSVSKLCYLQADNNFMNHLQDTCMQLQLSISADMCLDDLSCLRTMAWTKKNRGKKFNFDKMSKKLQSKFYVFMIYQKKLILDESRSCITTPILCYMHIMRCLLVQFFVRNLMLGRSAMSDLCRGRGKQIFPTSIVMWVLTACQLGADSFWLKNNI